jgi:hypothetical protein
MGAQRDPEFDEIEARGITRIYDGTGRGYDGGKRDEFSCPCCGVGTDSSECDECRAAECGEQDDYAGCLAKKAVSR